MSKKSDKYPVIIEKAMLLKFSKDFKFVGYEDKEYKNWKGCWCRCDKLGQFINVFDKNDYRIYLHMRTDFYITVEPMDLIDVFYPFVINNIDEVFTR